MHWKGKGKVYPRTGYEGPRGTVDIQLYSFFNPGASCRWVVNATPRPLYRRGRDPYLFYRGLCGAHGLFGRMRKISSPPGFFFFLFSALYLYFFVLIILALPLVLTVQHNTNIHAPGGIWTHNPSKQVATDTRLRPLGHWDRRIRSPDRPARSESTCRLSYPSPQCTINWHKILIGNTWWGESTW